jgi:site-specific DNA-cytosine methylase
MNIIMIKVLELFSGTKSIGKVCDQLGWESVSVDLLLPADHQVDIMDFDYKQYPKDNFDIVWASPPCTSYSRLQCAWIGRERQGKIFTKEDIEKMMIEADKMVLKALEIIEYFNCEYWFLENPQTGRLKDRDFMKDIPFYDVSYCMYSDWGYEKRTRIWTNKKDFNNKICDKSGSCGNMIKHKHKARMGTSKTIIDDGKMIRVNTATLRKKYKNYENVNDKHNSGTSQLDRYRIPEDLIFSLFLD